MFVKGQWVVQNYSTGVIYQCFKNYMLAQSLKDKLTAKGLTVRVMPT